MILDGVLGKLLEKIIARSGSAKEWRKILNPRKITETKVGPNPQKEGIFKARKRVEGYMVKIDPSVFAFSNGAFIPFLP